MDKEIIEKAIDEETLDLIKQLIALEGHLSDDAVRFGDLCFQRDKDDVRRVRKKLMRMLLRAPDQPPDIEIRKQLASLDCCIKHLCLSFVILTEICDLLSRAGRNEDVTTLLGYAKNINNMLHHYISKAHKILERKNDDQSIRKAA